MAARNVRTATLAKPPPITSRTMKKTKSAVLTAAVAGILLGTTATSLTSCKSQDTSTSMSLADPGKNACANKNECKNKGGCKADGSCKGVNNCKGHGGCANVKNDCKGMNDCRGQGGCKTDKNDCKGMNECKNKGGCKVGH